MKWLGFGALLALATLAAVVTQPTFTTSGTVHGSVDPKQLEQHTRALAAMARDFRSRDGLDESAAYIRAALREAGLTDIREQVYDDGLYRNVVATIGGPSDERVVVGAHYDTCEKLPGADDNASGVAGLIELARILAKHPPKHTVELVAYTLEEPPYFQTQMMGSAVHAESVTNVKAMLSLEMIGFFGETQDYPTPLMRLLYPTRGDFIAVVGDLGTLGLTRTVKSAMLGATPLPVRSINAPNAIPGIDFSDHASYRAHGIPAVMITDTAFFRNTAYHTADDTPDRLDYAKMADVVSAVAAAVLAITD